MQLTRRAFLEISALAALAPSEPKLDLSPLRTPVLFAGDATHAYRDPAAFFLNGVFHLFFTLVLTEPGGTAYSYVASSRSPDLLTWTDPRILTPRDRNLNYSSPGDVVRDGEDYVLCLQTYPRPHGERYGNKDARIFAMRSPDLERWSQPELLRVKGPAVPQEKMARMIDPFLLADKDVPHMWFCFYKQHGLSISTSPDLRTWTPAGRTAAGENPCVIVVPTKDGNEYILFHSPSNGVGIKRSPDLEHWRDEPTQFLGQKVWPWAHGRLTAAFVLDLRRDPAVGRALMFFHGSRYPETDPRGGFDNYASLALAWSDDLHTWHWPGQVP